MKQRRGPIIRRENLHSARPAAIAFLACSEHHHDNEGVGQRLARLIGAPSKRSRSQLAAHVRSCWLTGRRGRDVPLPSHGPPGDGAAPLHTVLLIKVRAPTSPTKHAMNDTSSSLRPFIPFSPARGAADAHASVPYRRSGRLVSHSTPRP